MQIFSKELLLAADDLHGVKEWTTYGTYTFKLSRRTRAKITIVGSGRDSTIFNLSSLGVSYLPGSGGGYYVGQAYLPAGTYNVVINHSEAYSVNYGSTEASTNAVILSNLFGELISVAIEITRSSNFDQIPGTIEHEEQGNVPAYGSNQGGASLYNGYGKGADAQAHNNTSGYFKIEW